MAGGQVCDVLHGCGGPRVGGADERGEAAQREAMEPGDQEAGAVPVEPAIARATEVASQALIRRNAHVADGPSIGSQ